MKKINQISVLLLIATIIGIGTVQGQQSSYSQICTGLFALNGTNISSITVLSDDQLTTLVQALDATTTIPMNHLPRCGTFWSLQQPGLPPLPSDTIGVNVWQLGDGSFLLNDVNYDYSAPLSGDLTARPMQMSAMVSSLSGPPGFGDVSTNSYTPAGSSYTTPQYGTNLWQRVSPRTQCLRLNTKCNQLQT